MKEWFEMLSPQEELVDVAGDKDIWALLCFATVIRLWVSGGETGGWVNARIADWMSDNSWMGIVRLPDLLGDTADYFS